MQGGTLQGAAAEELSAALVAALLPRQGRGEEGPGQLDGGWEGASDACSSAGRDVAGLLQQLVISSRGDAAAEEGADAAAAAAAATEGHEDGNNGGGGGRTVGAAAVDDADDDVADDNDVMADTASGAKGGRKEAGFGAPRVPVLQLGALKAVAAATRRVTDDVCNEADCC